MRRARDSVRRMSLFVVEDVSPDMAEVSSTVASLCSPTLGVPSDVPATAGVSGCRYCPHMDLVPIVDISNPGATSMAALDRACRDHGFFLLSGHGLDDLIARTFEAGRQFFESDQSVKDAIRRDAANPLGYNDRELTKRKRDHKEVFDFIDPVQGRARHYNRWPDVEGFFDTMVEHYEACSDLALRTSDLVLSALGLPEAVLARYSGDRTTSNMRLNHYTVGDPLAAGERDGLSELADVALGAVCHRWFALGGGASSSILMAKVCDTSILGTGNALKFSRSSANTSGRIFGASTPSATSSSRADSLSPKVWKVWLRYTSSAPR